MSFLGLAIIAAGVVELARLRAGVLWGVLSGVSYGIGISVLVEASATAGAWPAVAQRVCGSVVLGCVALAAKVAIWPPQGQQINGLLAGSLAGLTSVFLLIGLRVDAPPAVVTQSMFPVVSVVVGFVYFGDRVVGRQVVGLGLVLLGIAAVVGG